MTSELDPLLLAIASGGDEAARAERRLRELSVQGSLSRSDIQGWLAALAEQQRDALQAWLRQRSPESLERIYYRVIDALPPGVLFDDVVTVLGPPDSSSPAGRRRGRSCTYAAGEGSAVYLEADDSGVLAAWRSS
jgi:hypothetical protein